MKKERKKRNQPKELNPFDCKMYDKNQNKEINKCLNCTKEYCVGNCENVSRLK